MPETEPLTEAAILHAEIAALRAELEQARARAEQATQSEWKLKVILEHGAIGVLLGNLRGAFVYANRAMQEMLGYSESELLRLHFRDLSHPDEREEGREMTRRVIAGELDQYVTEKRYLHKSGEVRWGKLRLGLIRNDAGVPVYSLAMVEDITRHKQMEDDARNTLLKLQAIVDHSADAIYVKDIEGRYVLMNPSGAALVGRAQADFIGKRDEEIFGAAGASIVQTDHHVVATQQVHTTDDVLDHPTLGPRVFSTTKYPYQSVTGEMLGVIGISRDITSRKLLEQTLETQNAELVTLDRLKTSIVSAVSHEFRTPLTLIKGYTEFLGEQSVGELSEAQLDFISKIGMGVDRLERLVSDLLDISTIEAGVFRLMLQPADLCPIAVRTVNDLRQWAAEARLKLELSLPEAPLVLSCDEQRVEQVITNLLINAIKFSPQGGIIRVSLRREVDHVRLEVSDPGVGVPAELLPRLFERFSRLENGLKRGGTGLGLSISKALIEAHGGTIGVHSREGRGSTFWFTLPMPAHTGR